MEEVAKAIDGSDDYKTKKLAEIRKRLGGLKEDVEQEGEETERTKDDISDLEERIQEKPFEELKVP